MGYVYLAVIVFLLAAGGTVVWKYNHSIAEAAKLEQSLKAAKLETQAARDAIKDASTSYDKLQGKYNELDSKLKAKTQNEIKLRKQLAVTQASLEALKNTNPVIKDWADQSVPTPVVNLLRNDSPADGKGDKGGAGAARFDFGNPGSSSAITIRPN